MRCKSCNNELIFYMTIPILPNGQEEDLCGDCKRIVSMAPYLKTKDHAFQYEREGLKLLPIDYYDNVKD